MKVADILDRITNAEGMADSLLQAIRKADETASTEVLPMEKKVELDYELAKDIQYLIAEYIGLLEDKDVK